MGALKPTVSGIGFHVQKEFGAAEIGILSTQRISCGRDPDFIYTKNFARPGSGFYLHKRFRNLFGKKLLRKMTDTVYIETFSALRAPICRQRRLSWFATAQHRQQQQQTTTTTDWRSECYLSKISALIEIFRKCNSSQ